MVTSLLNVSKVPGRLLLVTLGRLCFVPIIILSFDVLPLVTALAMAIFIAADLYDGVLARQLDADDPARRALDTVVDRLSIWPVYVAVTILEFLPISLLALFAARELYCGYWCCRLFRSRDVVIRADWMYRTLNLLLAAWIVVAPFVHAQGRSALFILVLLFSVVVSVDLTRSARLVLEMPRYVNSVVIPAGYLRARHSSGARENPHTWRGALRSA